MSTVLILDGKLTDHKFEYKSHNNLNLLKEKKEFFTFSGCFYLACNVSVLLIFCADVGDGNNDAPFTRVTY